MRKIIVSLLTISALCFGLGLTQAYAGCQDVNLSNQTGSFVGSFCIDLAAGTISLDGTATVKATGATYGVEADATISGTPGHYIVAGTVTIKQGNTVINTITFSSSGYSAVMAETSFVSKAINLSLSQPAPKPVNPSPWAIPSMD